MTSLINKQEVGIYHIGDYEIQLFDKVFFSLLILSSSLKIRKSTLELGNSSSPYQHWNNCIIGLMNYKERLMKQCGEW